VTVVTIEKLFGEDEIRERVEQLAQEIAGTVPGDVVIVGLLKGCFVFLGDLVRALYRVGACPEVEFMRLSSYGLEKTSSGLVHLIGDVPMDVSGRKVLLVDDIVDTGRSVAYARALLKQRDVADLWICALVDKPSRREVDVTLDFIGFTIADVFIAGYGIDYAEQYRSLPYIGAVQ
jgi:hypoxanthine phosphoribosyltransferase